jgi:thiamine biosynthesis lipoprotein
MGTTWSVRLVAPTGYDFATLQCAIETRLADISAEMSHWDPTSLLCRFNHAPAGSWLSLPTDFATVMAAALDVAGRSGGAFDPTIGRLVDLRGFGATPRMDAPTTAEIEAAREASGHRRLAFDRQTGRIRQPGGLWLDLSGIAKGYAVDAIADLLAKAGISHCLVEIGGEFVGRGIRPDGDPWWVDLETPPDAPIAPFRVALHQLAVATSGDYVRGRHTLDPVTGRSVENGVTSVSVVQGSAMMADAWASALTVMGEDRAIAVADAERLAVRMITSNAGRAREWISRSLRMML